MQGITDKWIRENGGTDEYVAVVNE